MKTVIFKWNPAISSYSMLHYLADIRELNEYEESDWRGVHSGLVLTDEQAASTMTDLRVQWQALSV